MQQAQIITLKNQFIAVTITNYGARWVGLITADKNGKPTDVVAGFKTIADYEQATSPYYGPTIGRFANRIANGSFTLDGETYHLPINNGLNALHGGGGWHNKIWEIINADEHQVSMKYTSPDGEDGFPGEMEVKVTYKLDGNAISINYEATTSKTTVVNLTNHAYFNLNGEGAGNILNHSIQINADAFVPVNENLIPSGELRLVDDTPFNFKTAEKIGARINIDEEQLNFGRGYDHTYVLTKAKDDELSFAAKAVGEQSGISLEIETTEPGMQFYTGNFMDGTNIFKSGVKDDFRTTFALETQHFPDSPNQPGFPSTVLHPGEVFRSVTVYRFGISG